MKKLILIAASLLIAVSAASAQTTVTIPEERGVTVNGRAERKITPDEIYVAIILRDNEPKGETVDRLETRMKREFAALGIDLEKNLRIVGMNNAPRRRNQVDTARTYELKVGSATMLATVFEVLGEMGVTQAGVSRLAHSHIEEFRSELRAEAVLNAKKIANELSAPVKRKAGSVMWIQDNGIYENSPVYAAYKTRAVAMDINVENSFDVGSQDLEMQQITLICNVTVKFEFAVL